MADLARLTEVIEPEWMSELVTQFNALRTQVNNLSNDSSFQGTNLIAGTGTSLSVEFSEKSASLLTINSVDITVSTAGLQVGSAIAFNGQFMTFGRAPECHQVLDFPMISWEHARMTRTGSSISVEDLGSTNGTFVNDESVIEHTLRHGDQIRIGRHPEPVDPGR